jgi:hypothetical protein
MMGILFVPVNEIDKNILSPALVMKDERAVRLRSYFKNLSGSSIKFL